MTSELSKRTDIQNQFNMNKFRPTTHSKRMTDKELWKMFEKTGDIEWYGMYRSMKESKEDADRK